MKIGWGTLLEWLLLPAFCVGSYFVGLHPWLLLIVTAWLVLDLVIYLTIGKMFGWTIGIIVDVFRKDALRTEAQPENEKNVGVLLAAALGGVSCWLCAACDRNGALALVRGRL
ncbi:hypothetical protein [Halocynthiibacter styelae]|uniref:Uncharacterized protein n=1 Tax=Halocynthiibacter styelae TaxID=2761955 RepID=A0A8J7IWQ7_9RHOB|nr:hypothetical protein [Paenihalocynthiibacter styelae]MBI1493285.1 hypothetical protein [Paenihalocynthiibacter styelae]